VDCVKAGHWLLQCALSLAFSPERFFFPFDEAGFPTIAPEWEADMESIRDELLWRNPVLLPHTREPPDWAGWRKQYTSRLQATFVRDWRPETKVAIEETFNRSEGFEHARGVDALRRVPLRIDSQMLALVDRFAVEVMGHVDKKRRADQQMVANDIRVANYLGDSAFWLDHSCDKRGRVFSTSHFNYAREDHVRCLFRFAHGLPLGPPAKNPGVLNDLNWLEIHCANCQGETEKKSWTDRVEWTAAHRGIIEKIARDPVGTFELWRDADKPFSFVAACRELTRAWADPADFVTHLPIGFDGTCSGIQHLAMLARDEVAGKLVNLTNAAEPHDIYGVVIAQVRSALETDDNEFAQWWRDHLRGRDEKQIRKLLKTPIMTFAYSVTEIGMADQISEDYEKLFQPNRPLERKAAYYLALKIVEACKGALPGPAKVMEYIRDLAEQCTQQGRFLEWRSPTGFPVSNRYQRPRTKRVPLIWYGDVYKPEIAIGALPKINKRKVLDAAAPNFVHSLDAAHLIRVVLGAQSEGVINVLTVHDCFACLAPQAARFNQIIRRELAMLYARQDHLCGLRDHNQIDADAIKLPEHGQLDPFDVQQSEYPFI
jgi:DNA-directed RNA polymerase